MQDKYVGDIGDFGKYVLLKNISIGFKLGVNWCYVKNSAHKSEGNHIEYLKDESQANPFIELDPKLFRQLRAFVLDNNMRKVINITTEVIENAKFYNDEIPIDQKKRFT